MSTRHVILGLLEIAPMSGYDLASNLKISFESLWAASYGQIYPALHALEAEGLVRGESQPTGKRERIVYHITPEGSAAFQAWLEAPVHYLPTRDPFRLWASYLNAVSPELLAAGIERHLELQHERLLNFETMIESIETGAHPLIQRRAERMNGEALARIKRTRAMIFRELAAQARFELESAERIRAFARDLGPPRG